MSESNLASLGRRFVAALLDGLILSVPAAIASHVIPVLGGIAVWFFYAPVLEASEMRATLGKHLMGIQVVDLEGRRLSFRASLVRNLLKLISTILCFIGHLFAFFTSKKQALHDLLADTLVVYGRSERSIADSWAEEIRGLFGSESVTGTRSSLSELERLHALREKGAITQEEFEAEKKKIL